MRAEWPQSQLRWIAHRQEALWNKSLWLRMCRKLKWQLTGCNSSTSFVAMCAISCIKSSSLQALVTLVPASRWIVYGVHGLSGVHAPNVVTRSDLSRAAIIAICGRRLDESSFTCFRYFWNLCLFVFCLMKLFSILALVRRIATTLLANLANPSYRVQPSRHWQNTCSTSFTSSPLCYFYVDMQIVNMVHIHYNTLNDGERERERDREREREREEISNNWRFQFPLMRKILRRFRQRDILKLPNHCGKMPGAPCLRWMIRTYTINRFQCPYIIYIIYICIQGE